MLLYEKYFLKFYEFWLTLITALEAKQLGDDNSPVYDNAASN